MRRLVALGLLVVVAACSQDGSGLASGRAVTTTDAPGSTTTALADVPAPVDVRGALDVELAEGSEVPAGPHTWVIEVTNTSGAPVVVTFPSAQRGDAVVAREDDVVHRWSDERFFEQQVSAVSLDPDATESFELSDDLSGIEPGFYVVTVSVAVVGPPEPMTRSIRVVTPGG